MSDQQLRELERRFNETRDLQDEVALLAARVRAGSIPAARIELAAYLLSPAARELLGADAPTPDATFRGWASGLEPFGPEANMRCTIAAARRAWRIAAPFYRDGDPGHPLRVLEAAEQSVLCPCLPHLQALLERAREAEAATRGPAAIQLPSGPAAATQACLATALLIDSQPNQAGRVQRSWWGPEHARLALCDEVAEHQGDEALTDSLLGEAGERIRVAVRARVIPWALGHGDPVRGRVQARQREAVGDGGDHRG